jgi:quercetin dioxygenase-like cupin family protein
MTTLKELSKKHEGEFATDLGTVHHFSDGMYAKQMLLPAGYMAVTHAHKYSHLSILAGGEVIVRTDDSETHYSGHACIEIKAHVHHSITAIQDSIWFCVHATDETDKDLIDEVLIARE